MGDLEDRLRDLVVRGSQGFEPSGDLPERIFDRVRARHRRRLVSGGSAVLGAAAALLVLASVVSQDRSAPSGVRLDGGVVTSPGPDEGSTSTEAAPSSSTTTTTTAASSSSTTPPGRPTEPLVDIVTPLSRTGIGPIVAGMTLREAQAAARITITEPSPTGSGDCLAVPIESAQVTLVVELTGQPGDLVMDGVIRAVEVVARDTEEGFPVTGTPADLVAFYGPPTRTDDLSATYGPGWSFQVFEAGGFAYGATVTAEQVLGLESGDPAWLNHADGCP